MQEWCVASGIPLSLLLTVPDLADFSSWLQFALGEF